MQNRWSAAEARRFVDDYGRQSHGADLALRVYTSRLLGAEPSLVLHGGGNTSVKTRVRDIAGDEVEVLCVKGSGWDLAAIEPAGLPAVRLAPLRRLQALDRLSDEDMVNALRCNLLDAMAPTPSVETLLHAFLPHAYVDHTHANAVLALSDQPNGLEICREVFGDAMTVVEYVMPGFRLAKAATLAFEQQSAVEGLVLHKHGIFTFGDSAEQAYERMIRMVTLAEARIARGRVVVPAAASLPASPAPAADVLPVLRGACAEPLGDGRYRRFVASLRDGPQALAFCNRADLSEAAWRGVVTPDHTIRIKHRPLVLRAPEAGSLDAYREDVRRRVAQYGDDYRAYFERHDARSGDGEGRRRTMLDPLPRVLLVPGVGVVALGTSKSEADIVADVAETTIATLGAAEAVGRFEPLPEAELFEMEYWSLEQAKLGKTAERPLARQAALVTGGAGAIGAATARLFARQGAEVVVLDLDGEGAQRVAQSCGRHALGLACDVTDPQAVRAAFDAACRRFGGVDIVVSNAGAAWEGAIATLPEDVLRRSFELNFFAHQSVAQNAVRVMKAQGTGGALLFNVSKQAVNPGPGLGAYGAPKAATFLLARQYALEHGADGIRVNVVNADRIRSGLLTDAMIAARASARGVDEAAYMRGNLLREEVSAEDVAEAFLHQALAMKTTGGVTTVDGGNIAAALR
ncbi:class II aldolase/adducin family protein (plasmid) [Gemmatirosa kalamazoonensis]|uniref:Class II aldolase/adducin family protein n=1 Tax=Gemmatirosa kalamazoonensis TaxID=861299 RepID=W0RQK0_9BACT|nr:bifunctional aldolase/short-chain dehydrogenase [Gemmatirosa kalamazoonensis]AHG93254.1 class II aldolase/adducin family protein [Gemmatirosa kalamazoonensis]